MGLMQKLFGTHSEHELKRIYPIVDKVESYRDAMGALSDEQLKGKTKSLRKGLQKARHLMIFFRKLMLLSERLVRECLEWSITESRLSVVLFFIRDV